MAGVSVNEPVVCPSLSRDRGEAWVQMLTPRLLLCLYAASTVDSIASKEPHGDDNNKHRHADLRCGTNKQRFTTYDRDAFRDMTRRDTAGGCFKVKDSLVS